MIGQLQLDPAERNVLVTHYFVTDAGSEPELSDSETRVVVGGLDQVEASVFACFDYTALGHILSLIHIWDYFDENGMDIDGMSDDDLEDASEVFSLPNGKYLVVEG